MTDKQKNIFMGQLEMKLSDMRDDRERMAFLVRMLWHSDYLWGGENITGADCSGSISFAGYLLGYNVRVTADAYDKKFTDPLQGIIPEAGDVCIWYNADKSRARHIAMFSDHLLIMDADRSFVDTPVNFELMDRPGQPFSFKRLNLKALRKASKHTGYAYSIDEELKPLFGIFKSESW